MADKEKNDLSKDIHAFEQAQAFLTGQLPGLWWNLFVKLKEEGFTEKQAMELLREYIAASCSSPG